MKDIQIESEPISNHSQTDQTDNISASSFIISNDSSKRKDPFQRIMECVGNHGRFQLIYNLVFVMGLSMCGAMIYMNIILALNIPDHWCTVPGHEATNYTLDEWRTLTLPTQKDNRGTVKYSSCEMFMKNFSESNNWQTFTQTANVTVVCQHGWSYDQTWYESTIPTQENWVCSKDMFVTNVFVVGRATEAIGSFVLGQMGDIFGRRLIYYINVICSFVGRLASILTTGSYMWFLMLSSLTAFTINCVFQSPQIIGLEISREENRSAITAFHSVGWSLGTTLMPLLFWLLRDWESYMWYTTAPILLVLIFSKYVIESPRWLINKRRFADAIVQLKKIAKINGRQFDLTEEELTHIYNKTDPEFTYGIASLFRSWRLARNTIIMGYSWCVVAVAFFTLVLLSSLMGGNLYVNFLLQSIVEIPGYLAARYFSDTYGRRFTNTFSFLISFIACIPVIILATDTKYEIAMMGLATFIKFVNAITYFTVNLQGMEIYPTCMRQTGIASGTILSNTVGMVSPYCVYLGTNVDIRAPYFILALLYIIGAIGASFLPETLHKKLPDTIEEAQCFGIHDKYFSLPKAPRKPKDEEADADADTLEDLNQSQFAP